MDIYVARNGESLGPFTDAEIRGFLRTRVFSSGDMVCPAGKEN